MKRIAFTVIGTDKWIGGRHYIKNLLNIILLHQSNEINPILFLPSKVSKNELESYKVLKNLRIVRTAYLDNFYSKIGFFLAIFLGRDFFMQKLFAEHKVDKVFTNTKYFGWRFKLPVVVWIPDLQHKFLKYMFSKFGYLKREAGFRLQIWMAQTVMLSSNDAKKHCNNFYKHSIRKSVSVPFAVKTSIQDDKQINDNVCKKYNIPSNYLYVPNQFWRHKNHIVVLDAVSILKKRNIYFNIIFTGELKDNRNSNYYDEFLNHLNNMDISDQVYVLGKVPYEDVIALMKNCEALINPSLFEGWSTTVEEAKSLGIKLLLSDISVHFEQLGNKAKYFEKNSALSLANLIEESFKEKNIKENIEYLKKLNDKKVFEFSEKFKNTMLS